MTVPYLETHRPARRQFRQRYAAVDGVFVVHTAESPPDVVGPDTGTDNVARFIADRSDPGSYHLLADSDSWLQLVAYALAAYGDGTGSNEFAIHGSIATQAAAWARLPKAWREAAVRQLAAAFADASTWVYRTKGIVVPARRITREQSEHGVPGFISHAERDPSRRHDPGADFPWALFLATYDALMQPVWHPAPPPPPVTTRDDAVAQRRRLTELIAAARPGRLREKLKAARNRLPKPPRKTS